MMVRTQSQTFLELWPLYVLEYGFRWNVMMSFNSNLDEHSCAPIYLPSTAILFLAIRTSHVAGIHKAKGHIHEAAYSYYCSAGVSQDLSPYNPHPLELIFYSHWEQLKAQLWNIILPKSEEEYQALSFYFNGRKFEIQ